MRTGIERFATTAFLLTAFTAAAIQAASSPATPPTRAGPDWWSLEPIRQVPVPDASASHWAVNPIDAFILNRLAASRLQPSPPADRRELLRRIYFDLLGLPPTPEQSAQFLTDGRADSYDRLVDQLLSSPQYGEHWARHWMDIARFGESDGFERDQIRTSAWRYRDWLIDAFNADMPYDLFARMQIAGDVLRPGDPGGIIATGFLVTGAYDAVGQTQQSAAMRAVVRQDEMEDLVGTTAQTFLSLTANCARCHDHKFDPIRQVDYYRLSADLAGVTRGDRAIAGDALKKAADLRIAALDAQIQECSHRIAQIEQPVREKLTAERTPHPGRVPPAPLPIARWDFERDLNDSIGALNGTPRGATTLSSGLHLDGNQAFVLTAPLNADLGEKTLETVVQLSNLDQRGGGAIGIQTLDGSVFDAIVFGEREPRRWMAGSDGFSRTQSFVGPEETDAVRRPVHIAIVYSADGTIAGYRNGIPYGRPYHSSGPMKFRAKQSQIVFGLRHLPQNAGKMLAGTILHAALYDRALSADEVARAAGLDSAPVGPEQVLAALDSAHRTQIDQLTLEAERLVQQKDPERSFRAYAVIPGPIEPTHLLRRGNPATPAELVPPGGVAAVDGAPADFGLAPDAPDADRRIKLAQWITDERNPLFARAIVNRLWQYHFGVGLVDTPNDFGFNGGRPSHPELLDWLASELIRRHWSIKQMQRLIVTSATYRQSSAMSPDAAQIDPGDRLLWRQSPQRLEAESLRDAVLSAAGELNLQAGGPGFQDFSTFIHNTQFYVLHDYVGKSFNRRSIYRTWVRSGRNPMLDVFDCPDPSTRAPRRALTTTPLQALSLMNDSFILRMADRFAERLTREAGTDPVAQIARAYQLAFARSPDAEESAAARQLVERDGLPALCRVLFNCNEFAYVD